MINKEIKERVLEIYPMFTKNIQTWTDHNYYRQMPQIHLKDLADILNDYEGVTKYTCLSCNIGALLNKLRELKKLIDSELVVEVIEEIPIKEEEEVEVEVKPKVVKPIKKKGSK